MTMSASRTIVAGRYEVDLGHPLGTGGMATVYKGRDLRARRAVAVKMLRPEYQSDPDSRRRFRQEARLMAFVSHPNLVTVYDLHEESSGSWVVMEYVPGENLKKLIERHGPLPPEEVLPLLEQVSGALGHLHGRNLVHLDIKPQNLIVTPDGSIKLIDFGLAQPAGPRQEMVGGTAFGTVAYLAPEQASGDSVDAATDVYAVGCVVYELLTGQPPFQAPDGAEHKRHMIRAHLELLPLAPSAVRPELGLPSWVDDVVGWALAKSRRDRYHDIATFARMFRLGIEGEALPESQRTSALPASVVQTGQTTWRARRIVLRRKPPQEAANEDLAVEDDATPPGTPKRPIRAVWRLGGRAARRTRPIRGALWRLALIFALGNALLGIVLMVRDGPAALVERFLSVAPGATTEVTVDSLNLRAGPGVDYDVIDVLRTGDAVDVTGLSASADGERWWPVEVRTEAGVIKGWAWDEGLRPNEWTGRLSWMQNIVDRGQRIRDGARDALGDLRSIGSLGSVPMQAGVTLSEYLVGES